MRILVLILAVVSGHYLRAEIPKVLAVTPYDVVVPMLNGDPSGASKISGQLYYDVSSGAFKGVDSTGAINQFVTTDSLPSSANTSLSNLSSTAINTHLLPAPGNWDVGRPATPWNVVYSTVSKAMIFNVLDNVSTGHDSLSIRGDGGTTPSGYSVQVAFSNDASGGSIGMWTGGSLANNSDPTASLFFGTGNKGGGTGDSGDIELYTGTSLGGSRGHLRFVDGSEGTVGHVWTQDASNGSGRWAKVTVPQASSDPSSTEGDLYYNTVTHKLRLRTDVAWVDLN